MIIHSFIHSFYVNQVPNHEPGIILSIGDSEVNKIDNRGCQMAGIKQDEIKSDGLKWRCC